MVDRAMKYAAAMKPAVAGQRGHDTLLRFCSKMLWKPPYGFGLTASEAWPIARIYNQRCRPMWQDRDILRKFEQSLRNEPSA
jgi:hypothetical protein